MDDESLIGRVSALEVKVRNLEAATSNVSIILQRIATMDVKMDNVCQQIQGLTSRLTDIERKPAGKWDALMDKILTVIITAVCTYALSKLLTP